MFWFDKLDNRVIFIDRRKENYLLKDASVKTGVRKFVVCPDVQADFMALPFLSNCFNLIVFDPPHRVVNGRESWMHMKYGTLPENWQEMLMAGFKECFRVLHPCGTLILKWSEYHIKVADVLKCTKAKPLFGNRRASNSKAHWIAFSKPMEDQNENI